MGEIWLVVAGVSVVIGLVLLWLDRRRRSRVPPPPVREEPREQPGDLFREYPPR